jgi:hypothetical protein
MKILQEQLSFPGSLRYTVHPVHSSLFAIIHMDVGYEDNAGVIIFPWLLETYRTSMGIRRSLPSMAPRHTVHPVHSSHRLPWLLETYRPSMGIRRSLPSMAPRHTVHPVHKKADTNCIC